MGHHISPSHEHPSSILEALEPAVGEEVVDALARAAKKLSGFGDGQEFAFGGSRLRLEPFENECSGTLGYALDDVVGELELRPHRSAGSGHLAHHARFPASGGETISMTSPSVP